jgi:glycosyltransferase involved in cell wall biosynthesis
MKKVLIITYYWPPSGGGGVMRWLKFSKYLPSFDWHPVIFTPSNPDPSVFDESLLTEIPEQSTIIKIPIWEPYQIYRKLLGKKKDEKFKAGYISEISEGSRINRISVFIRGNLLIPDPRRFWIKPAYKYLLKYLKQNPVDFIVTTGPPHSMHLIGHKLRQKFNIPWLADFRDPWTNIDFYQKLRLTKWADKKHKNLERKVLQSADIISTVSWSWSNDMKQIVNRDVEVITNGYDPDDFDFELEATDDYFSIVHIGSFNADRNPELLWDVLKDKVNAEIDFQKHLKLIFIGQTDESVFRSLKKNHLMSFVEDHGYLEHTKSLAFLKSSQVLLLPLNDAPNVAGIIPGKLYEYLAANRPILAIGPEDGDSARIINETKAGKIVGIQDRASMEKVVDEFYQLFRQKKNLSDQRGIDKYSRLELTRQLVNTFSKKTGNTPTRC